MVRTAASDLRLPIPTLTLEGDKLDSLIRSFLLASDLVLYTGTELGGVYRFDFAPQSESWSRKALAGLTRPYIIIQAALGLKSFARFVKKHPHRFRDFQFLALPVGPVLGDHPAILERTFPKSSACPPGRTRCCSRN